MKQKRLYGILVLAVLSLLLLNRGRWGREVDDPAECQLNQDSFCTEQNCINTGGSWTTVNGLPGGGICRCDKGTGVWEKGVGCQYVTH